MAVLGTLALAGVAAVGIAARGDWRELPAAFDALPSGGAAPLAPEPALPLPRRGDLALARARSLAAEGHLRDALSVLDRVRATDPERPDADRLRGELQRQLLALTAVPADPGADRVVAGDQPSR
jgi:hypothetical protein